MEAPPWAGSQADPGSTLDRWLGREGEDDKAATSRRVTWACAVVLTDVPLVPRPSGGSLSQGASPCCPVPRRGHAELHQPPRRPAEGPGEAPEDV